MDFQPYLLIKSLCTSDLPHILSSPNTTKTWLNRLSNENQISNMPSLSVELLALILSAQLVRSVSDPSGPADEFSLTLKALCALVKSHSSMVCEIQNN